MSMSDLPDPLASLRGTTVPAKASPTASPATGSPRGTSRPVPNPAQVKTLGIHVRGDDSRSRGLQRASQIAPRIRATTRGYEEFYDTLGISTADVRHAVAASLDAMRAWDAAQFAELEGVAAGSGITMKDLALTVARTEILTLAHGQGIPECSTVAHQSPGRSVAAQTWDWHAEFATCWHYERIEALPGEHDHAGFSEFGMVGKVGMNSAGVGVLLNILNNTADAPGGVPIHCVLASVLTHADSAAAAAQLIAEAPTSSSSVLTVVDADEVRMVEVAPGVTSQLTVAQDAAGAGWLTHTNHFLATELQEGAVPLAGATTSKERLSCLATRTADAAGPQCADDLIAMLATDPAQELISRVPALDAPWGERAATLVTVRLDPALKTVRMSPGIPQEASKATTEYVL